MTARLLQRDPLQGREKCDESRPKALGDVATYVEEDVRERFDVALEQDAELAAQLGMTRRGELELGVEDGGVLGV